MEHTELHIKNMVCDRCIMAVEQVLSDLKIPFEKVKLGTAILNVEKNQINCPELTKQLDNIGFEVLIDPVEKTIKEIKNLIVNYIHYNQDRIQSAGISEYLSTALKKDYNSLSRMFSEHENISIEKYIILQKIEKIKELLSYGQLNISEISYQLDYSSVQHLSAQFKKIVGVTPSQYKKIAKKERKTLDQI